MGGATTVLEPGVPVTIAPAGHTSFEIESGQRLRLTQPQGEQVADFISFNRDDVRELLSMHSSRAVNLSWKFTAPDVLYSNRTREMWKIDEDLTGENYCGGGYCSEHLNLARYGEVAKGSPNCQTNLTRTTYPKIRTKQKTHHKTRNRWPSQSPRRFRLRL